MARPHDYDEDFFSDLDAGATAAAQAVLPLVLAGFRPRSVIDVGCGSCAWLAVLMEQGVDDVVGVDGSWNTVAPRRLEPHQFIEADLESDLVGGLQLGRTFDLVMSIEVAEHLPPERAAGFIAGLCGLGDRVLFSAAIPGQGGEGHVNEAWPSYWASLFLEHGFSPVDVARPQLWDQTEVPIAVRQNLLLYTSEAGAEPGPTYLDVVHPQWAEVLRARAEQPGLRAIGRALPGALGRASKQWPRPRAHE